MTATAEALKCKWCRRTSTLNGRVFTTEHGLHTHEALCADNPDRKTWSRRKKSTNKIGKALAKRNGHALDQPQQPQEMPADVINIDYHLGYAVGNTEARLESIAGSIGIPAPIFAARVARLLQRSARGQVLGTQYRVS